MKALPEEWYIFDFTTAEAKVVRALLKHGRQSVSALARNAAVPRSTVNYVLKNLQERKLVRRVSKGYASVWRLVKPEKIDGALEAAGETLGVTDTAREIESAIGVKISDETGVFVYRGMKDILEIYEHFLFGLKGKRIYVIETPSAVAGFAAKVPKQDALRFSAALSKQGLIIEAVFPEGIKDAYRAYVKDNSELPQALTGRHQAMRLVPDHLLPGTMELMIVGNTALVSNYWEEVLVVIQNQDMVTFFKSLYSMMYSMGTTFDQHAFMRELAAGNKLNK